MLRLPARGRHSLRERPHRKLPHELYAHRRKVSRSECVSEHEENMQICMDAVQRAGCEGEGRDCRLRLRLTQDEFDLARRTFSASVPIAPSAAIIPVAMVMVPPFTPASSPALAAHRTRVPVGSRPAVAGSTRAVPARSTRARAPSRPARVGSSARGPVRQRRLRRPAHRCQQISSRPHWPRPRRVHWRPQHPLRPV